MTILFKRRLSIVLAAVCLLTLAAVNFGRYFLRPPALSMDHHLIVTPLAEVKSVSDYWSLWKRGGLWDLQPVRDLSFLFDYRLQDIGLKNSFFFSSLFLGLLLLFLLYQWGGTLGLDVVPRLWVLFFVSAHPSFVLSVLAVAARKHLLAAVFFLACLLFLKRVKDFKPFAWAGVVFFIGVSWLSQPIYVFFSAWLLLWAYREFWKTKPVELGSLLYPVAILGLGLFVAWANLVYYSSSYALPTQDGQMVHKFAGLSWDSIWQRALLLGRFSIQLFAPVIGSPATYNLHQTLSYMGLAVFSGVLFLVVLRRDYFKINFLEFVLPFVSWGPFVVFATDAQGMETYILGTVSLGYMLGAKLFEDFGWGRFKPLVVGLFGLVVIFGGTSLAMSFKSRVAHWEQAYFAEGKLRQKLHWAEAIFEENPADPRLMAFFEEAIASEEYKGNEEFIGNLVGRYITGAPVPIEEKLELFKNYNLSNPVFRTYWALTQVEAKHYAEAYKQFEDLWRPNRSYMILIFVTLGLKKVFKAWVESCEKTENNNCHPRIKKELQESLKFERGSW